MPAAGRAPRPGWAGLRAAAAGRGAQGSCAPAQRCALPPAGPENKGPPAAASPPRAEPRSHRLLPRCSPAAARLLRGARRCPARSGAAGRGRRPRPSVAAAGSGAELSGAAALSVVLPPAPGPERGEAAPSAPSPPAPGSLPPEPGASCCAGPAARRGGAVPAERAAARAGIRCRRGTMAALPRLVCASSVVLVVWAGFCSAVCVEVPSETEAVQGTHMKLLCISCMKREEVTASTVVEWFYRPEGGKDEPIYEYRKTNHEFPSRFSGRLQWNGSKDMQDVSITVLNVTLNDSGIYTCNITREFEFEIHRPLFTSSRLIHLTVVEEAGEDFTSVISEIMMYILLVFLTLWLLIEMVYCYRKVSKAEEAAQENATDYLAIPSENKENCAVPVEE